MFHFMFLLSVCILQLRDLSLQSDGGGMFDDNQIFLQYVYSKEKVLLLYDGVDDLDLLKNILPRDTTHVHVLLTTRMSGDHSILARANRITSLGRLGPDAGVKALQAWRGHAGENLDGEELMFAKRVVSENPIEGLPLAIAHAGTCTRKGQISYQQYYWLLKREQSVLQALALDIDKLLQYFKISSLKEPLLRRGVSKPNDLSSLSVMDVHSIAVEQNDRHLLSLARYFVINSNHVHLTWQLDIETVKTTDSKAMQILLYASLMACRNIPEHVLRHLVFGDAYTYEYRMSVGRLTSCTLVDVSESNEDHSLHMHPLVQSTLLERVMREPEELHYKLNRMTDSLLHLLPHKEDDIQRHLKDDHLLSLLPHVYAVAEKAVWIHSDETCNHFMQVACRIALEFQHVDVAAYLCHEWLKATGMSGSTRQHVTGNRVYYDSLFLSSVESSSPSVAQFLMGKAFDLMANPRAAQLHFVQVLQSIESSGNHEETRMGYNYQLGEFELRFLYCYPHFVTPMCKWTVRIIEFL